MYNKINRAQMYIALVIALLIQLFFADNIKIAGVKPDLFTMMVIFFSIFFGPGTGLEAGFISGLFKDIYSLDIFGANIFTLSLTGVAAALVSPKFFKESRMTQAMLVFLFSLLSMIVHYYISSLIFKTAYIGLPEYLFNLFIPSSLYTSVLSVFIFPYLIKIYSLKENAEYL